MKLIAILASIQLASCAGILDTLSVGIQRQKNGVQSTLNRLDRHKRDFSFNLGNKLSNAKINSMQEINNVVNPTLKSIEEETKKSTADGKNATHCYEMARTSLRDYSLNGFNDLENCRNEALSSVSSTLDNMDSAVTAGHQVITYLDSIFPSCFTTSVIQMQNCIANMLPEASQLARSFQTTAETAMNGSNSVSNTAQLNAFNCNRGVVSNVRDGSTNVRLDANGCIASISN